MGNSRVDGPRVADGANSMRGGAGCLVQLVGPLVAVVVAVTAFLLVSAAWRACADSTPGGGGYLLLIFLPGVFVASWLGFALAGVLTFWAPPPIRLFAAVALAFAIGVVAVAREVPVQPASDAAVASEVTTACGADGIPTWWPFWLPH
jgi:hypothetical protein